MFQEVYFLKVLIQSLKRNTDMSMTAFSNILLNLELSYEELRFIQNEYNYSFREQLLIKFFNLTYNDLEVLDSLLDESSRYLEQHQDDILVDNICKICKSFSLLHKTNKIEQARSLLNEVWERLSKRDFFYISDIYLINMILLIFPLETALEIKNFAFRCIDKYKNFRNIERLKINMSLNFMLLLMKDNRFEEALNENNLAFILSKKYSDYLLLAICYIRKGICENKLNVDGGELLINKGKKILNTLEEYKILNILEEEIEYFRVI